MENLSRKCTSALVISRQEILEAPAVKEWNLDVVLVVKPKKEITDVWVDFKAGR